MILRRISSALRKQDWATVLIEILIVVVGVGLGIEVANWNEARVERHTEQRHIELLFEDISASLDLQAEQSAVMLEIFENARDLAEALRTGDVGLLSDSELRGELLDIGPWAVLTLIDTTLVELNTAGGFRLITDETLKRQIVEFKQAFDDSKVAYQNFGGLQVNNMEALETELKYAWRGQQREIVTEINEILSNPKVASSVERMVNIYYVMYERQLRLNQETEVLHKNLKVYIDRELKK